jgi:uncharacterized protein DUF6893
MRTVGIIATVIAAGLVSLFVVVVLMSIPDIRRYLAMRRM